MIARAKSVLAKLEDCGVPLETGSTWVRVRGAERPRPADRFVRQLARDVDDVERGVDLTRKQSGDRQGIAGHENELHINAIFFEQATLPRDPDMGHALTRDAGR